MFIVLEQRLVFAWTDSPPFYNLLPSVCMGQSLSRGHGNSESHAKHLDWHALILHIYEALFSCA